MLTGLILENFKTFGGVHPIPLGPLTVIYGANSSGKSSILQALLFLKQNVHLANDEPDLLAPFDGRAFANRVLSSPKAPIFTGPDVDTGNLRQLVHGHKTLTPVSITPLISTNTNIEFALEMIGNSDRAGLGIRLRRNIEGRAELIGRPAFWSLSAIPLFVWTREPWPMNMVPYRGELDLTSPFWLEQNGENFEVPRTDTRTLRLLRQRISDRRYSGELANFPTLALWGFRFHPANGARVSTFDHGPLVDEIIELIKELGNNNKHMMESTQWFSQADQVLAEIIARSERTLTREEYFRDYLDYSRIRFGYSGSDFYLRLLRASRRTLDFVPEDFDTTEELQIDTGYGPLANKYLKMAWKEAEILITSLTHIGPSRILPVRVGTSLGNQHNTVGKDGRHTEAILLANPDLIPQVNFWLSELQITHRITAKYYDREKSGGRILITDETTKAIGSLCDVGFGVSQILPVIVELIMWPGDFLEPGDHGPILIEQPELHLHPAAQARLAYLINEARQRRQVIIETHSEHLLLALQNLVQTGNAKPEDVCVLRVTKNKTGSRVHRMEFGENGSFEEPWLDEFFPDRYSVRFGSRS